MASNEIGQYVALGGAGALLLMLLKFMLTYQGWVSKSLNQCQQRCAQLESDIAEQRRLRIDALRQLRGCRAELRALREARRPPT